MTADRDDLASILAKHRHKPIHETETFRGVRESYQIGVGCRCGWGSEGGYQEDDHRAHVAQMVLESDWLAAVKAQAWDEGRDVGHEDTYLNLIEGRGDFDAAETPNPYRTTEDA